MKLTNGILTVLTVGLLAILAPATAIGATITVCWDGSADYSTIQAGINAAVNGDEVVVCAGTYTGSGNKNLDFDGRAITVRGEAGPDSTIIDCEGGDRGFYFHSGEGPASIVEGFTITNGHAFGGGGIRCSDSSPTITNCTIIGNSVVGLCVGGGIYCPGGSPTITNCTISENWGGEIGGGFYCTGGNPAITNCTISGNSARLGGGGIYSVRSNLAITSCTISGNSTEIGGGIYTTDDATVSDCTISTNAAAYYGGGICCDWSSNTMFTNCMISGNWAASEGGGMFWIYRNYGNMTMVNCTMSGNWAPLGGGICCTGGGSPAMTNCTMSGNGAWIGGGIRCYDGVSLTITNCMLWGDTAAVGPEIALTSGQYPASVALWYGDVQGGQAATHVEGGCTLEWGDGNTDADPRFVRNPDDGGDGWGDDPSTPDVDEGANDDYGDLHLQAGSPCIDAGDSDADVDASTPELDPLPDTDLDGKPRFLNDPHTPDTGNGTPPIVDMGAYEFSPVFLDIKPGGCPNPLNRKSRGKLPVALLGTEDFDVAKVDPATVQLSRADGVGGTVAPLEGPPGPHSVIEDVGTPFDGELCDCHGLEGDGIPDLAMKFNMPEVVETLELTDLESGGPVELVVLGNLLDSDGTAFAAFDCVWLVPASDFDRDSDVDQADFGHFQICFTGPDQGPPPEDCEDADLDDDGDVDLSDFGVFQACISGPGVPSNPACAD